MAGSKGFFRCKEGFTVVQNTITRSRDLTLRGKGLYLLIQDCITKPGKKWTKDDIWHETKEGKKAFEGAWTELKNVGYLKVHLMPDGGRWHTEYELLDSPDPGPHTLYHNKDGDITSDNLRRAEKKRQREKEQAEPKSQIQIKVEECSQEAERKQQSAEESLQKQPETAEQRWFVTDNQPDGETRKSPLPQKGGNAKE